MAMPNHEYWTWSAAKTSEVSTSPSLGCSAPRIDSSSPTPALTPSSTASARLEPPGEHRVDALIARPQLREPASLQRLGAAVQSGRGRRRRARSRSGRAAAAPPRRGARACRAGRAAPGIRRRRSASIVMPISPPPQRAGAEQLVLGQQHVRVARDQVPARHAEQQRHQHQPGREPRRCVRARAAEQQARQRRRPPASARSRGMRPRRARRRRSRAGGSSRRSGPRTGP